MKTFFGTASITRRILAFVIDLLIVNTIIVGPFSSLISSIVGRPESYKVFLELLKGDALMTRNLSIVIFFISILALLYFSILEWKIRQTPGQMITGLYVAGEKKEISFWQCAMGNIFMLPFFPFFLLWFIDPVFLYLENRRFTEKVARIKIVQLHVVQDG